MSHVNVTLTMFWLTCLLFVCLFEQLAYSLAVVTGPQISMVLMKIWYVICEFGITNDVADSFQSDERHYMLKQEGP